MRSGAWVLVLGLFAIASTAEASDPLPESTPPSDDFSVVIAAHETEYATDRAHAGRAHNVALAASLLDGAVIAPGETFSFNGRVGARTRRAGFREAPEINEGHLTSGIGGGVCQVASTLHLAALRANLDIVEHRTHSIASTYAAPGMDATVVFDRVDYRVRNPHAFAVRLRAHGEGGVLRVWIEGARMVDAATVDIEVARRIPAPQRVTEDTALAPGAQVVEERGRAGVVAVVRVTRPDGTSTEERVRYAPLARVVRVGRR